MWSRTLQMSTLNERESTILEAAAKLPPEDAAAYLDEACGGDAYLHQRISAALFEAQEKAVAIRQATSLQRKTRFFSWRPSTWGGGASRRHLGGRDCSVVLGARPP